MKIKNFDDAKIMEIALEVEREVQMIAKSSGETVEKVVNDRLASLKTPSMADWIKSGRPSRTIRFRILILATEKVADWYSNPVRILV